MWKKKDRKRAAEERIAYLWTLLKTEKPDTTLSKNAVKTILALSQKTKCTLPRTLKQSICKTCLTYLKPGTSARVRITKKTRIVTCTSCNALKRYPLQKIQKKQGTHQTSE